jgi:hypothetical protein
MNLERFLAKTARGLPTAADLMAVCDELGIVIAMSPDGRPALRCGTDVKEEAQALSGLLRREPWRSQVIAARGLGPKEEPPPFRPRVWLWRFGQTYTEGGTEGGPAWSPVGAWWWKYEGEAAWRLVSGREEYAKEHELPEV